MRITHQEGLSRRRFSWSRELVTVRLAVMFPRALGLAAAVVVVSGCVSAPPIPCTDCGGSCVDVRSDVGNCGACGTKCADGQVCAAGKCELRCPAGLTQCDAGCFDRMNDPRHCGGCGMACSATNYCSAGSCTPISPCTTPRQLCGTSCVDTRYDPQHCGRCGNACAAGKGCLDSMCTL